MTYILAQHTGKGFYTQEDRINMPNFSYSNGMAFVDGNYKAWVERVNGEEITLSVANSKLSSDFETAKTAEVSELTQRLSVKTLETFKSINLK